MAIKRGFLFDLDGTLVNTVPLIYKGVAAVCRAWGIEPPPLEIICDHFYAPWEDCYRRLGIGLPYEDIWRIYHDGMGEYEPELFPAIETILRQLNRSNTFMAIVSANRLERVEKSLKLFSEEVRDFFKEVICGQDDKVEVIKDLVRRNDLLPTGVFYIGDTPTDIHNALEAGVRPIGLSVGYSTPEMLLRAGAEQVFTSHYDLLTLLHSSRMNDQKGAP